MVDATHNDAPAKAARTVFEICAIGKQAMIEVSSRLWSEPGLVLQFFTRRFFVAPPPVQDLLLCAKHLLCEANRLDDAVYVQSGGSPFFSLWHDRRPADDDASRYFFACAGVHYWDATAANR
jgi:hypothetical protein